MDALSDNLFRQYQDIETLKDLLDRLKTDYETSDMKLQFVLRNKFLTCRKSKRKTISDYMNRLIALSHDLKCAENEAKDADFILTLVNGSPSASSDRREFLTKNKFKYNENKKTLSDKKKRKCYNCGTPGHFANDCKKQKSKVSRKGYCVKENESKPRVCQI